MLDTPVLPGNLELAKLLAKNDFEVTAAQQEFRILDIDLDSQLLKNFLSLSHRDLCLAVPVAGAGLRVDRDWPRIAA